MSKKNPKIKIRNKVILPSRLSKRKIDINYLSGVEVKKRKVSSLLKSSLNREQKLLIQAAQTASIKAQQQMLDLGVSVIKQIDGEYYRIYPDGKREILPRRPIRSSVYNGLLSPNNQNAKT